MAQATGLREGRGERREARDFLEQFRLTGGNRGSRALERPSAVFQIH